MTDKLETFIDAHISEFDTLELPKDLWSRIDVRIETKNSSRISSKWLSVFKYLGFGASVLVVAVYLIAKTLEDSSENSFALNRKDSAISRSERYPEVLQNRPESNDNENGSAKGITESLTDKNRSLGLKNVSSDNAEPGPQTLHGNLQPKEKELSLNEETFQTTLSGTEKNEAGTAVDSLSKETDIIKTNSVTNKMVRKSNKKVKLYVPEEPVEMDMYNGTLYEGSNFRDMLRAYKFPGKFSMEAGGYGKTVKTISCIRLEKVPNLKAVWLKGRTNKEIVLSVRRNFSNIQLVKKNGRKVRPEAISHYYRGLGVISDFKGKYFNLLYKDKVELILFFKDAEEGDRIIIDGRIEASVRGRP